MVPQAQDLSIVSRLLSPLAVEKQAFAVLAVLFQVGKQAIGVLRRLCFIKASFSLYYRIERIKRALSSPICLSRSLQWWCREGSLALQSFFVRNCSMGRQETTQRTETSQQPEENQVSCCSSENAYSRIVSLALPSSMGQTRKYVRYKKCKLAFVFSFQFMFEFVFRWKNQRNEEVQDCLFHAEPSPYQ